MPRNPEVLSMSKKIISMAAATGLLAVGALQADREPQNQYEKIEKLGGAIVANCMENLRTIGIEDCEDRREPTGKAPFLPELTFEVPATDSAIVAPPERRYPDNVSRQADRSITPQPRERYVVKEGDTLQEVDRKTKSPGPWTRLAYVNRQKFGHADIINAGQVLVIPRHDGKRLDYAPLAPPAPVSTYSSSEVSSGAVATTRGSSSNAYVDPWGCEAEHAQEWSDTGKYWGKYQFDRTTWDRYNTDGEVYGEASEAEQDAVAARVTYDAWPDC